MRKLKKGDVVTPKKIQNLRGNWHSVVNRTTLFQEYKVIRTGKGVFFINDDNGMERMCYAEDWDKVTNESSIDLIGQISLSIMALATVAYLITCILYIFCN
jgi:hypothetical protein